MPSIHSEGYDKEVIEKLFKNDSKLKYDKSVCFKLNTYQYNLLKLCSEATGRSTSEICREVIYDFLLYLKDVDNIEITL